MLKLRVKHATQPQKGGTQEVLITSRQLVLHLAKMLWKILVLSKERIDGIRAWLFGAGDAAAV